MNIKSLLSIGILLTSSFNSVADEPYVIIPTLSIEQQIYLSDKNGLVNPNNIIRLKPLDSVIFYLSDGTEVKGIIKSTEEVNKEVFKAFGDVESTPNAGFGFALTKDGIFAGAIAFDGGEVVYTLEFSYTAKGYWFIKSKNKMNKTLITEKSRKNFFTPLLNMIF